MFKFMYKTLTCFSPAPMSKSCKKSLSDISILFQFTCIWLTVLVKKVRWGLAKKGDTVKAFSLSDIEKVSCC